MGKPLAQLGQFSQGLDPGPAQGLTRASPGLDPGQPRSIFWSRFWSNRTTEITAWTETRKGRARFARARPFGVAVNAVVPIVLFDQILDQKIDLGWPGLAQVKPWAGPVSNPGKAGPTKIAQSRNHFCSIFTVPEHANHGKIIPCKNIPLYNYPSKETLTERGFGIQSGKSIAFR